MKNLLEKGQEDQQRDLEILYKARRILYMQYLYRGPANFSHYNFMETHTQSP